MTLRVGFVGAGWWAVTNHMPLFAADPRVTMAGVCRIGAAELAAVRDRFGFALATESFDELLDRGDLDALVISTPHALHAGQAIAAAGRGLHVLVEKPVALTLPAAEAVAEAVARAGVHGVVPLGWNFKPFMAVARDWLAAGELGELQHVAAHMASPIGDLLQGRDHPGLGEVMFRPDPVMWSDPRTGGYGWGQLVHLLGALFWLAPDLRPQAVRGLTRRAPGGADIYDAAVVTCEGGETLAITGAATLPAGRPFEVTLDFYGTEGVLSVQMVPARVVLSRHDGRDRTLDLAPDAGHYECTEPVRRFIDLCHGLPVVNAAPVACAVPGTAVIEAMHRSAALGRDVETRELREDAP